MNRIFLGVDFFAKKIFWEDLQSNNSVLIGGLSGSGKSYLTSHILDQFSEQKYRVIVVSDKSKVDFKSAEIEKIDPLTEKQRLEEFIVEMEKLLAQTKRKVEISPHSHSRFLKDPNKIVIVVDELWSINKLEKELRQRFENLCEQIIRQGRYLSIFIIFVTQVSSVAEVNIPIRQCSLIITGKTDTRQLSESLFGSDIAYSSDFLGQGIFVVWNRLSPPKFIKIQKLPSGFSIYKLWNLKLLKKIWTIFR